MTPQQKLAAMTHHVRLNKWSDYFADLRDILVDFTPAMPEEIIRSLDMAKQGHEIWEDDLKEELTAELEQEWENEKEDIKEEMREEFAEALEAMAEDYK